MCFELDQDYSPNRYFCNDFTVVSVDADPIRKLCTIAIYLINIRTPSYVIKCYNFLFFVFLYKKKITHSHSSYLYQYTHFQYFFFYIRRGKRENLCSLMHWAAAIGNVMGNVQLRLFVHVLRLNPLKPLRMHFVYLPHKLCVLCNSLVVVVALKVAFAYCETSFWVYLADDGTCGSPNSSTNIPSLLRTLSAPGSCKYATNTPNH